MFDMPVRLCDVPIDAGPRKLVRLIEKLQEGDGNETEWQSSITLQKVNRMCSKSNLMSMY